jgi:FtsH-binding integral membrane protein
MAEVAVRAGFLRKVLGLLLASLAATFGAAAFFRLHQPAQQYVLDNMWTFWSALISTFVVVGGGSRAAHRLVASSLRHCCTAAECCPALLHRRHG